MNIRRWEKHSLCWCKIMFREQNTLEKFDSVAVSRNESQECSHCTIYCNCDATRLNMFIPVAVSLRPSPTVASRRKGITHQPILCNWLVADNRVASRRLVWARLKASSLIKYNQHDIGVKYWQGCTDSAYKWHVWIAFTWPSLVCHIQGRFKVAHAHLDVLSKDLLSQVPKI